MYLIGDVSLLACVFADGGFSGVTRAFSDAAAPGAAESAGDI